MSRKLPYGKFNWIDYEIQNEHEWIKEVNCDEDTGYFVECDLHYPKELHDLHNETNQNQEPHNVEESLCSIIILFIKIKFSL